MNATDLVPELPTKKAITRLVPMRTEAVPT